MSKELSSFYFTAFEEKVDHSYDNRRRFILVSLVIGEPFDHYEQVHVAKHCQEEDDLGEELVEELVILAEVESVQSLLYESKRHVQDSNDHGELHLE